MGKPVLSTTPGREWELIEKDEAPQDLMKNYQAAGNSGQVMHPNGGEVFNA